MRYIRLVKELRKNDSLKTKYKEGCLTVFQAENDTSGKAIKATLRDITGRDDPGCPQNEAREEYIRKVEGSTSVPVNPDVAGAQQQQQTSGGLEPSNTAVTDQSENGPSTHQPSDVNSADRSANPTPEPGPGRSEPGSDQRHTTSGDASHQLSTSHHDSNGGGGSPPSDTLQSEQASSSKEQSDNDTVSAASRDMPPGGAAADTNELDGNAGTSPLPTETVEDKRNAAGSSKAEADVKGTNVPLGGTNDGSTTAQHFAPLVLLAGACAAVLLVAS
ncbi:hypothetical protein DQ04_21541000 [Trypanosoma grayi]|uniref:hypothetical protein n=1 Tax=Trypanosoma grayi TaxID=71804 RepID=UPI0004F4B986|nr:hypothetical protein DQ04_21541000 [Trypanosoma grayi]KEG05477.1 hypothetical protein DQ04_21541000 [Trypanosoma grayi]